MVFLGIFLIAAICYVIGTGYRDLLQHAREKRALGNNKQMIEAILVGITLAVSVAMIIFEIAISG